MWKRLALEFWGIIRCSVALQTRRSISAPAQFPYNSLRPYEPPLWAMGLRKHPAGYVQLAMRPTPLHYWDLPGVPAGFQVWVKRDDMTGSTLSGNKIRKLEFLLADALHQGCDSVVTCGSIQSNHARTTAIAARQLGMKPHLILKWPGKIDAAAVECNGNLLLNRLSGATIILVPPLTYGGRIVCGKETKGLKHKMQDYKEKLRAEGSVPYLIPVGGSNAMGVWGYIEAFREMVDQGILEHFDDIVLPTGRGGTMCGIALGNYLTGSKVNCTRTLYIDATMTTEEELAQLIEIVSGTGVFLDPVYTLKGVRGMLEEMRRTPERFAGKRILYIHTGGAFLLYDGTVNGVLKATPITNQFYSHADIIPE